ncbi:MFS transporter [Alicyclobacillus tolerans]|nr:MULTISPECIES: MFS transporter [Alicyclobacillus]QRF23429.1 MFS transporter [Alicyclobacillus sp. TC]SHJ82786.1 drug resistance transporter, EmrB/QacA subfamily [Alicyclobacillus montanus]
MHTPPSVTTEPNSPHRKSFFDHLPLPSVRNRKGYHWFVVGTVCIGAFMAALDASIINIALPTMQKSFQVTMGAVEWVSLTYLLTLAALIIPLGRMADIFGRRWMYAIGFSVFIVGSFLCGISPTLAIMNGARVLQAIGAAMLQANSVAIITAATPLSDRGKAIGIQGSAQGIGLSLGPAIGGAILSTIGWRWIFFVNVPVGIIGTLLGILLLPRDEERKEKREPFDIWGAIVLAPTLVGIIYFVKEGQSAGWTSPIELVALIVGVLGLILFIAMELKKKTPLLDLKLFKFPQITIGNITGVLSFASMYSVTLLGPFFLDRVMHLEPYQAGLLMMIVPIGMTIFTPISGILADRYGARILTVSGMAATMLGGLALFLASGTLTYPMLVVGLFLVGSGLGLFTPPNNASVMNASPRNRLGVTGGILNMARTLGMSLGVTLGGVSYEVMLSLQGIHNESTATLSEMNIAYHQAFLITGAVALIAMFLSFSKRAAKKVEEAA